MTDWLRRNRWGLILLIPALALAVAASSFLLLRVYLPWYSPREVHVEGAVEVPSSSTNVIYPNGEEYTATLTPASLVPVGSAPVDDVFAGADEMEAAPGARLWRLRVDVAADPAMVLSAVCTVSLEGPDGTQYRPGLAVTGGGVAMSPYNTDSCVPRDSPGPSTDLQSVAQPAESGYERPSSYTLEVYVSVPTGVTPAFMRVDPAQGEHWVVDVPAV